VSPIRRRVGGTTRSPDRVGMSATGVSKSEMFIQLGYGIKATRNSSSSSSSNDTPAPAAEFALDGQVHVHTPTHVQRVSLR